MSCVVGIVENGKGFIGADSMASNESTKTGLKAPKVWRKETAAGVFLGGTVGSCRAWQVLMYDFQPPRIFEGQPTDEYMVTSFIPVLKRVLEADHLLTQPSNSYGLEIIGYSQVLIIFRGQLFRINSDFAVIESSEDYVAIGSGEYHAYGCLYATQGQGAGERITKALEAASKFTNSVGPPFTLLSEQGAAE